MKKEKKKVKLQDLKKAQNFFKEVQREEMDRRLIYKNMGYL